MIYIILIRKNGYKIIKRLKDGEIYGNINLKFYRPFKKFISKKKLLELN